VIKKLPSGRDFLSEKVRKSGKAENFKNKISVLKASYNSWNNDISVPECRIVGFSFNSEIIQSENILLKKQRTVAILRRREKRKSLARIFALGALHQKDVRI